MAELPKNGVRIHFWFSYQLKLTLGHLTWFLLLKIIQRSCLTHILTSSSHFDYFFLFRFSKNKFFDTSFHGQGQNETTGSNIQFMKTKYIRNNIPQNTFYCKGIFWRFQVQLIGKLELTKILKSDKQSKNL